MIINSLTNTTLLPNEAADPIANRKEGLSPLHRSQTVTGIEPTQKSNRETDSRHTASDPIRSQENSKQDAGQKPATGAAVTRKESSPEIVGRSETRIRSELRIGSNDAVEINTKSNTDTGNRLVQKSAAKTESDGPQLQLLKRQLAAKRSLARQIYLNTLDTKVIDNVGTGIGQPGESDNIAEVTETLNDYAQIIKRDLTFSQQDDKTSVAIHVRDTGELIRTISSEQAREMSGDIDQFKNGHLLEVRA